MTREGPPLEALVRRLAETPEDFLVDPRIGERGHVHVAAVVGDLLELLGGEAKASVLEPFEGESGKGEGNRLSVVLMLAWLLSDEWFRRMQPGTGDLLRLLDDGARELAGGAAAKRFLDDPERREEMARLALARLGLRPAGETEEQADDRLASLSSAERSRVLKASKAAEKRARAIREALARKAAEESADKWTRE
jgi:hypothetical protein